MQDSMELPSSQGEIQNHNQQFQLQQVISPKGRRLNKGFNNNNTASQQSLAYSNSTHNKFTERSPPFFNIDNLSNQNINTLNFRTFDKKQSTFGSGRGLVIQFDKIKEQSCISNFDQDKSLSNVNSLKEKIQLPYFLSNQNSPNKVFQKQNDSLDYENQKQTYQTEQNIIQKKNYIKINPSNRKNIKENIVKSIQNKIQAQKNVNNKLKKGNSQSKQNLSDNSHKTNKSSLQNEKSTPIQTNRHKSPVQIRPSDEILLLKQKIKELEYALQVQSISTQQLRTKVSVLNQLLQEKFLQKNGINFKLFKNSSPGMPKFKNSLQRDSKNFSNIDLYVEMKIMEKAKQEIQIQFDRVKNQLSQKSNQLALYSQKCQQLTRKLMHSEKQKQQIKTQTSFGCGQVDKKRMSNSLNTQKQRIDQNDRIYQLQQEKQTLLEYIQNQKASNNMKDQKIKKIEQKLSEFQSKISQDQNTLMLLEQKQKRFTQIQRPKLLIQIKQLNQRIENQKQQIQRLEMQNNLRQLKLCQGIIKCNEYQQSPQGKFINKLQQKSIREKSSQYSSSPSQHNINNSKSPLKNINSQTSVPDAMSLIMLQQQQLKILKNQRDYFKDQSQFLKQLKNENYNLQLKNEDLENQLNSLHQLIQVQDQITF